MQTAIATIAYLGAYATYTNVFLPRACDRFWNTFCRIYNAAIEKLS